MGKVVSGAAGERARELARAAYQEWDERGNLDGADLVEVIAKHVAGALAAVRLEALEQAAHICDFAANGTVEQMCVEGRSETWKIIAEQSVEQYRSIAQHIRALKAEQ